MEKTMFRYSEFNEETADNLVVSFNELVLDFRAGLSTTKEYNEKNQLFTESFSKYCIEKSGGTYTGLDMLKNPQLTTGDVMFTRNFQNILAQAIVPAVPTVASSEYTKLYEIYQVGWGDAAKYTVESNEYFIVYDIAEGINRQNQQTAYNNEYSITTHKKTISVQLNWYQVAAGKFDWGKFGVKVAKSFEAYIQAAAIREMTNIITNAADLGIAGYLKAGTDPDTWIELAQLVKGANDSEIYALGTLGALQKVKPEDAGFRYNPKDDLVTVGYLPSYLQVPMVEIDQAVMPGTINTAAPALLVQNDYIFFIAMGSYKPIKVAIEGQNIIVSQDPLTTKDNTLGLTISMYIGIEGVVGSKFGVLDVSN